MSQGTWPNGFYGDFAGLAGRREALRQAAMMPDADPRALLDATLAELDAAVDAVTKLAEAEDSESAPEAMTGPFGAERGLLRAVFQNAPVPLFVLEHDLTIRRANGKAGELIGTPPGYATGKLLTAFIDIPSRAAVQSQLAAAIQTGTGRQAACKLLGPDGPGQATLAAGVVSTPDGARLLVVTVSHAQPTGSGRVAEAAQAASTPGVIAAMTRRMDLITAVTRLLLDNSTFSEAVTLQRCARLLEGDIASWVIVDIEREGQLRRQFVMGPHDESSEELARKARAIDPQADSMPAQVHAAGRSVVLAHAEDSGVLGPIGAGEDISDRTPLMVLLGATSLLSVPITDGVTRYGVLTLARQAAEGHFDIAELGLAEELGEHLGVAIRVDRMFRHRSAVAEALQGSLLPDRLPDVPGLELSAAYVPATEGLEVSGDFYDVFPVQGGWAMTVGDVCG
jgi:PAS domain-containing protein